MKIREITEIKAAQNVDFAQKTAVKSNSKLNFSDALREINEDNYKEYFSNLYDRIKSQGEVLSDKTDIRELQRFRLLVSEFMSEAVKFSYKYEQENTFDNKGRQKVYANVRKIDNKLDELARMLLEEQRENIEVIGLVDDICGLVIDMLL